MECYKVQRLKKANKGYKRRMWEGVWEHEGYKVRYKVRCER